MTEQEDLARIAEQVAARVQEEDVTVTVVGDLIFDIAIEGRAGGTHPETGVELLKEATLQESIGGAGNIAVILSRLGAKVTLFGIVGSDLPGRQLAEMQDRQRYRAHVVVQRGWPTPTKHWVYERDAETVKPRIRIDYDQPLPGTGRQELLGEFRARFRGGSHVLVVADHGLGVMGTETEPIIDLARESGAKVVAIPRTSTALYQTVDALVANPTETRGLVGLQGKGEARVSADLFASRNKLIVFLTQGQEGLYVANGRRPSASHLAPTQPVENPQKMGARDMVLATVALALALDLEVAETSRLANALANLVVAQRGNGIVFWDDLFVALGRGHQTSPGIGSPR